MGGGPFPCTSAWAEATPPHTVKVCEGKGNFGERKVIPLLVLKIKDKKPNETKPTHI